MRRLSFAAGAAVSTVVALTAYVSLAQTAPAPLQAEKLFPAGKTLAFVQVADAQAAEAAFAGTDVGQIWKQLEAFRAELEKGSKESLKKVRADFKKETGVELDDALLALKGGIAVGAVDTAPPDAPEPQPGFILALSSQHKALVEKIVKKATGGDAPPGEAPQGPPPFKVIERDGAVIVTTDEALLPAAGAKTLADDPTWKSLKTRMMGASGTPFLALYVNADALIGRAAKANPQAAEQLAKSGIADVKGVGLAIGAAEGRLREAIAIAAPGERHGFLKVLTSAKPLDAAALAKNVPAEAFAFSALRFDAAAALDDLIDVVKTLDPDAAKQIEHGIADLETEIQLKVRADLLGTMGDVLAFEASIPEDGLVPDQVMSFAVKDAAKLESSIAKIAKLAQLEVKSMTRAGKTIKYLQAPLGKLGGNPTEGSSEEALGAAVLLSGFFGSWTIEGQTMYVASLPHALEERFERLAKGSLADQAAFKEAMAKAPAGARLLGWGKARPVASLVYQLFLMGLRATEPTIRKAGVPLDTALLPRAAAFAKSLQAMTISLVADGDGLLAVCQTPIPMLTWMPAAAVAGVVQFKEQQARTQVIRVDSMLRELLYASRQYHTEKGSYPKSLEELVTAGVISSAPALPGYELALKIDGNGELTIEARPLDMSKPYRVIDATSGEPRGFGEPPPGGMPPEGAPPEGAPPEGTPPGSGEKN